MTPPMPMIAYAGGRSRSLVALLLTVATGANAQFPLHRWHEMPGVCLATAYIDVVNGGIPMDSIVWSNGYIGWMMADVPADTYSVEGYLNSALVYSTTFILESNAWSFPPSVTWVNSNGLVIAGQVYLEHCNTAVAQRPCCLPIDGLTHVELLQDGLPFDQRSFSCSGGAYTFMGLPLGHQYQVTLVDPDCAGTLSLPPITAFNCANLQLNIVATGSVPGQYMGSIEILDVVPDTTETYPIYAPVLGNAQLYQLPGWLPLGALQDSVTQASWFGLDAGFYVLTFAPLAGCQMWQDTIEVPALLNVNVGTDMLPLPLTLGSTVTTGLLHLYGGIEGAPVDIRILDARGRLVQERLLPPGVIDVSAITRGMYLLIARQGDQEFRARFVRR